MSTGQAFFSQLSRRAASAAGKPTIFGAAAAGVLVWALCGPIFHFSESWQLVVNTATTIITFLMVFLIQHTQNRDAEELHLKIAELIRATEARNHFIDLEDLTDEQIEKLKRRFKDLATSSSGDPAVATPPSVEPPREPGADHS